MIGSAGIHDDGSLPPICMQIEDSAVYGGGRKYQRFPRWQVVCKHCRMALENLDFRIIEKFVSEGWLVGTRAGQSTS